MAAAINAGHDGVLVATDRRLIFVASRRDLSLRYDDIASVRLRRRRWLGAGIAVCCPGSRATFSGIRPSHARELSTRGRLAPRGSATEGRARRSAGLRKRPESCGARRVGAVPARPLLHGSARPDRGRHQRRGHQHEHECGHARDHDERVLP